MSKWNGDLARERIADRLTKHGDAGSKPTSEQAFQKAKEIVQRRDRMKQENK